MNITRDSQELIDQCLSCTRYRCVNCIDQPPEARKAKISEDLFYKLYDMGLSDGEIAEELKVRSSSVRAYRIRRELPRNIRRKSKNDR